MLKMKVEVYAACDDPCSHGYVRYIRSRVNGALYADDDRFEDLHLVLTLERISSRTSIDTRHVKVSLNVQADARGVPLDRTIAGKYYESIEEDSPWGCFSALLLLFNQNTNQH